MAYTNVALAINGSVATANTTFAGGNFPASAVINGDRRGRLWGYPAGGWQSATGAGLPHWVEVDFGATRSISEINVFTIQDNYSSPSEPTLDTTFTLYGLTNYAVQGWDGTSWLTIGSVTGNNKIWRQFSFQPMLLSKIRVNVTANVDGYSRLAEIEAWGDTDRIFPLEFSKLGSGSEFMTTVNTAGIGGEEQRIKHRSRGRDRFNAAFAVKSLDDVEKLRHFFLACGGQFETFLLKDPLDYVFERVTAAITADGTTTDFQLRKLYEDYLGNRYYKNIYRPKRGTIEVWADNLLLEEYVDYTVGYDFSEGTNTFTNFALASNGSTASANASHSSGNFPVASVNSGQRRATAWGTNNTTNGGWNSDDNPTVGSPDWVEIAFGQSRTITEIDVFSVASTPTSNDPVSLSETSSNTIIDFKVQYWNGSTWVDIANVTGNDKTWRQFTFSAVTTTKVRVLVTSANGGFARLAEIEAWGNISVGAIGGGEIRFASPPSPNQVIEFAGEFYKNCRFETDQLDLDILEFWVQQNAVGYGLVQPPEIPIIEVFT